MIVLSGPAGCGKTTIGQALARARGACFLDADDFHSPGAKAKMSAGQGLTDADRRPWLESLRSELERTARMNTSVVLACSLLKRSHRRALLFPPIRGKSSHDSPMRVLRLDVSEQELRQRLLSREKHFFTAELLRSQLVDLEPGDDVLGIDGHGSQTSVLQRVEQTLFQYPPT